MDDFPLNYDTNAIDQIIQLTRGHPYLIQLLCAELVALKNSQPDEQRLLATILDIATCIPIILQRGQPFFFDIEHNQMEESGRQCLYQLSDCDHQGASRRELETTLPVLINSNTLENLVRHSLIALIDDRYHIQVKIIAHWFALRKAQQSTTQ